MDTIEVLNNLFDQKILRIMKLFLTDRERELYLREIAKKEQSSCCNNLQDYKQIT